VPSLRRRFAWRSRSGGTVPLVLPSRTRRAPRQGAVAEGVVMTTPSLRSIPCPHPLMYDLCTMPAVPRSVVPWDVTTRLSAALRAGVAAASKSRDDPIPVRELNRISLRRALLQCSTKDSILTLNQLASILWLMLYCSNQLVAGRCWLSVS
jgi:hypothetical protein